MATTYPMPQWGITMEEGTIHRWLVAVGDQVLADQVIGEIGTAKEDVDYVAPGSGIVAALLAEEGDTVACGTGIVVLADDADDLARYRAERP